MTYIIHLLKLHILKTVCIMVALQQYSNVLKSTAWHIYSLFVHLQWGKNPISKKTPHPQKKPTCEAQNLLISLTCKVFQLSISKTFYLKSL